MSTVIEAGDGRNWEEHFPEVVQNDAKRAILNSALMLMAAWMTRTNSSAKTAARKIIENWWLDIADPSPADIFRFGWISWYIHKIVATKPKAYRT